jgi:hypothetical protein
MRKMDIKPILVLDILFGTAAFLLSFLPLKQPSVDETEAIELHLWKKKFMAALRVAGLILSGTSLLRLFT